MDEKKDTQTKIPIDFKSALDRTGDDETFLYELINIYVSDFEDKIQELKTAIKTEDFNNIQEIGHNLKGSSANLSLTFLQTASFDTEMSGREKDLNKANDALNRLESEFKILKEYFADKII